MQPKRNYIFAKDPICGSHVHESIALRVRFLFVDHLPVGKSLSAEGRVGTGVDLRLSFRVFEE